MATARGIKKKEHENLTDVSIKRVIELLEAEKPISKKDACEILNISYNTTRLAKIIDEFKEEQAEAARRRAANRGKAATNFEIQAIIESFLDGDSVADIAKRIYRPASFVKEVIEYVGVPQKPVGADYTNPGIIPDRCAQEEFNPGQMVWNAREHCMAIVVQEVPSSNPSMGKYYKLIDRIELIEDALPQFQSNIGKYGGVNGGAWAYDLGSLEHLKEYGVDVYKPYRDSFKILRETK